jgi:hypothetical protein
MEIAHDLAEGGPGGLPRDMLGVFAALTKYGLPVPDVPRPGGLGYMGQIKAP